MKYVFFIRTATRSAGVGERVPMAAAALPALP
jgi:hypothetical protein